MGEEEDKRKINVCLILLAVAVGLCVYIAHNVYTHSRNFEKNLFLMSQHIMNRINRLEDSLIQQQQPPPPEQEEVLNDQMYLNELQPQPQYQPRNTAIRQNVKPYTVLDDSMVQHVNHMDNERLNQNNLYGYMH